MRSLAAFLALPIGLAGFGTTQASAQHVQARQGFWMGFGLGYGEAIATCANCGTATDWGASGFLKFGDTLGPKTLLGGVAHAWIKSSQGATEILGNVTGSIFYYPALATGFFLTGGLGISEYNLGGYAATSAMGWGLRAGVGYDIRVGAMTSVTPVVDLTYGGGMSPHGKTGWRQAVIDLGVGVTFH